MTGGAAARPGYRLRSFQERAELRKRMERAKQSTERVDRWPRVSENIAMQGFPEKKAAGSVPVPVGNPAVSRCVARSATTGKRDEQNAPIPAGIEAA